jgi:hypothetical protein
MKVIIQMSEAEELKALPILLRDSPGTILPNRTYILTERTVRKLREHGIKYNEVTREPDALKPEGTISGERI